MTQAHLTIEQLALETGMTVRNIRSHRARGLLQPPEVRDRVGYYAREHVERLRLITELQGEGFNLKGIQKLIERTANTPGSGLLALREAVSAPFELGQPQVFTREELRTRFGGDEDPDALLGRVVELGLLIDLGGERFEAPAAALFDIAEELVRRGVPLRHALAVSAKLKERLTQIAREFVRLFRDDIWKPFEADGMPAEEWPLILESIDRLGPLSSQAVLSVYQLVMAREVEDALGREVARMMGR